MNCVASPQTLKPATSQVRLTQRGVHMAAPKLKTEKVKAAQGLKVIKIFASEQGDEDMEFANKKPPPLVFKARWLSKDKAKTVDTVQLIKVIFKLQYSGNYGEGIRLVGGHEGLGNWSLDESIQLAWRPGDQWVSEPLELPVDGIFVYKYVVCHDGDANYPLHWQTGNNQVLALCREDAPQVVVHDNWKGDPSMAFTCRPDGTQIVQAEQRILTRVKHADSQLQEAHAVINELSERLKRARYESQALREEARIGANARLSLKSQLAAERNRANRLEAQVKSLIEKEPASEEENMLEEQERRGSSDAVSASTSSGESVADASRASGAANPAVVPGTGESRTAKDTGRGDSRDSIAARPGGQAGFPKEGSAERPGNSATRPLQPPSQNISSELFNRPRFNRFTKDGE